MYGPLIIDLEGVRVATTEQAILRHKNTGAVLLFTRNYQDRQQLIDLVNEIRDLAGKPLLIMVDHEGGRIWRFDVGFNRPAAAASFGSLYASEPERALQQAHAAGFTIATELLACGVDLTLAPVLDLGLGYSTVIGDRAFHADPQIVTKLAGAFIAGLAAAGMAAVGKHFPGHGYCTVDTHDAIGKDERTFAEIAARDLIPFTKLHTVLQGIMPAHVIYPQVENVPTGFSKHWLQTVLREQIGFAGAIISDCLSMKGLGEDGTFLTKAQKVLNAGCDLVILTQQTRQAVLEVLDNLEWQVDAAQHARIKGLEPAALATKIATKSALTAIK